MLTVSYAMRMISSVICALSRIANAMRILSCGSSLLKNFFAAYGPYIALEFLTFCDGLRTKKFILLVILIYISYRMDEDWVDPSMLPYIFFLLHRKSRQTRSSRVRQLCGTSRVISHGKEMLTFVNVSSLPMRCLNR